MIYLLAPLTGTVLAALLIATYNRVLSHRQPHRAGIITASLLLIAGVATPAPNPILQLATGTALVAGGWLTGWWANNYAQTGRRRWRPLPLIAVWLLVITGAVWMMGYPLVWRRSAITGQPLTIPAIFGYGALFAFPVAIPAILNVVATRQVWVHTRRPESTTK